MEPATGATNITGLFSEGVRDSSLISILEEVGQLIHKFESTAIDPPELTAAVILFIEKLKLDLQFDEIINFPLIRELLGRLLKIKIESCQKPVIDLLKRTMHPKFLCFDVATEQSLGFVFLERDVSEAIRHNLNTDSKEIFSSLMGLYGNIIERLWLLPLLTKDRSSYTIIVEQHGRTILEHANQWLPVISKKYPDEKVNHLSKALERIIYCPFNISKEINVLQSKLQNPKHIVSYIGNIYLKIGDFEAAISCYDFDLDHIKFRLTNEFDPIVRQELEQKSYDIHTHRALAYKGLGEVKMALSCLEECRTIAKRLGDCFYEAAVFYHVGELYHSIERNQSAIESYEKSLSICQKLEDQPLESEVYENIETTYETLGTYEFVVNYHQASLTKPQALKNLNLKADIYCNLGITYKNSGDYNKAIHSFNSLLQIAIKLKDEISESMAHNNLGTIFELLCDYSNAIRCYEEALRIAKKSTDNPTLCGAYINLANAYIHLGDYTKALELNKKSLMLLSFTTDLKTKSELYGKMGNLYASLGNYIEAIEFQNRSLNIYDDDPLGKLEYYYNLGSLYLQIGEHTRGLDYIGKALTIVQQIDTKEAQEAQGRLYCQLGSICCFFLHDYEKAFKFQQKSLEIAKKKRKTYR